MAFIRSYAAQGDPFAFRTMRAGQLVHQSGHSRAALATMRRAKSSGFIQRVRRVRGLRRMVLANAGDPFSLRLPKFARKLSLKKVVGAVGKFAKIALPIAAPFLPGVGPMVAGLVGQAFSGGGTPESPAPELVQQPEYRGPVSSVAADYADYMVPGVEVSAQRDDGTYPGDYNEAEYYDAGPDDEDEDDYGDDELFDEED